MCISSMETYLSFGKKNNNFVTSVLVETYLLRLQQALWKRKFNFRNFQVERMGLKQK